MYTFNLDSISEESIANALEFAKELIKLENKYHVTIDSAGYEDWDEDLDGNPIVVSIEHYVKILNEYGYEICDLEYLRDVLKEQNN